MIGRLLVYGRLVRFSHTVFALPFAVMGALLAANGLPTLRVAGLILLAMVAARSASMAMNRLADHRIDAENPRTSARELPRGVVARWEVTLFLLVAIGLFVVASALLNWLTFALSPVALAVLLSYPFAKRFTSLCHLWLGAALGLSPVGAWVAVRGGFGEGFLAAALLGGAVLFWTGGFDIIYALLDVDFDRKKRIFSLPARLGPAAALRVSAVFHVVTVGMLCGVGIVAGLGAVWYVGVAATAGLLVYEHRIVRPDDLSRVGTAFFTVNGFVSIGLMLFLAAEIFLFA